MAVRFLKISTYYRDFLEYYYRNNPDIKNLNYNEQYKHLMGQYFSWSDNYGRLLSEKGMETMEIIANAIPMQKAWALANKLSPLLSPGEILLKQIASFKPEVIYFQDSISWNGSFIENLKSRFPFIRLCIGNICAPFTSAQIEAFKPFDFFTVCSPFFAHQFNKYGIKTAIIPHAFDKRVLTKINKDISGPSSKFVFTGSIIEGKGFHSIRTKVLEELIQKNIPFTLYGNLPDKSRIKLLRKQASYIAAKWLDNIGLGKITESSTLIRKGRMHAFMPRRPQLSDQIYKNSKPPVFGLEMFEMLANSEIAFNIHGDCAGDYAANLRLYEITGVGSCLLTDHKSDLKNYFEPDYEVVTYNSVDECIEKVEWLIANPLKRKDIALEGQKRTLKDHNFNSRVELFYKELKKYL